MRRSLMLLATANAVLTFGSAILVLTLWVAALLRLRWPWFVNISELLLYLACSLPLIGIVWSLSILFSKHLSPNLNLVNKFVAINIVINILALLFWFVLVIYAGSLD